MKRSIILILLALFLIGSQNSPHKDKLEFKTYCNPLDLSYRFGVEEPSRREAADPTVIWFKDRYYLFASKSGGYWHSKDLAEWVFLETTQIPIEEYAPTAIVMEDTVYFLASSNELSTIYKSTSPLNGEWSIAVEELDMPVWDPGFFLDDDNRLYLYWGCSNEHPLYGVEVDYNNNFSFLGEPKELIYANPEEHGWEVPGDYNTLINQSPWIEGAWMTKKNGKYYLQYAGPGTEFKSYSNSVYTADNPLGPFSLQAHNPFAYKPEGFAAGAGHGSMFEGRYGNLWYMSTITISQKHVFERRLGMFPAFYDDDGTLYSITKYGDYPLIMPSEKISGFEDIFPGWMLLSYDKNVEVSSSIDTLPPQNMADEDIRTYWAAKSSSENEYAILDLGKSYDVYSLQVNFAEHNTDIFGREKNLCHRYTVEYSNDGTNWNLLIDKSENEKNNSHDYTQLENKVNCRYLKINNIEVPDGHFALSGFRVFGKGHGDKPEKANNFIAKRNPDDRRSVNLKWDKSAEATGYNISYGIYEDKLYNNYMVYDDTTLTINSLNVNHEYYFSIESFNENGVTTNSILIKTN